MRTIVLVYGLLLPAAAHAQVKLEIAPYFASYYATALTARPAPDTTERQEAGPGIGLQATYRFNSILGVQGSVTYIWSGIIPKYPPSTGLISNSLQPLPGRITFASVRATVQPRRSNYYLAGGLGYVQRSGEAWDVPGLDHLTNTMASVGFGIRARVTPAFAFNIGVDANLYYSDPDGDALRYYQRRLQRDLLVTIGVPYALIER